jgi:thioredoxin reductase/ferredoxin
MPRLGISDFSDAMMMTAATIPVFLFAGAAVLVLWGLRQGQRRRVVEAAPAEPQRYLIHAINDERCTGCETCISACPTNVLALLGHKSRVVRFDQCVQCEACARVCPTQAMAMHMIGSAPPPIRVPDLDPWFQTSTPGQYLIGELAGKPLVKNAANLGRLVVEHMLRDGLRPGGGDIEDVIIIGSGPGGLSAALACIRHGLSYRVLEKESVVASTIARYPAGKPFLAEPSDTANLSFLPVYDSPKEELLATWSSVIADLAVSVDLKTPADSVTRMDDGTFEVATPRGTFRGRRVVVSTGVRGKPRRLDVPGEELDHVFSMVEDPAVHAGQDVLVVGGGDTALEAAAALERAGARVTLSYRKKTFSRAGKRNRAVIEELMRSKKIEVVLQSTVSRISEGTVTLLQAGSEHTVAANACFVLIGADPPVKWLGKLGVKMVERSHSHSAGKSDELLRRLVRDADLCPTDAHGAVARVRGIPVEVPRPVLVEQSYRTVRVPRPRAETTSVFKRAYRRLRSVVTPMPEIIIDWDADPTVVDQNPLLRWEGDVQDEDRPRAG